LHPSHAQGTLRKALPKTSLKRREAERRQAHPTMSRTSGVRQQAQRSLLASRRSTAALTRGFRPASSTPGHASWDADPTGVIRLHLSQSRDCTSRAGRSTGMSDAQSRPGAGFTTSTSFANPAVTIARALSDTYGGIAPAGVLAFIAAQMVGALVAIALAHWLFEGRQDRLP
jgi:hypothetical protein